MPGFTGGGPSPNAEFHRSHRWKIENLGLPSPTDSGQGIRGAGANRSQLALYARDLRLPELEFDIETIKGASSEYKVAKMAKWKNCTVTFYDVYGLYREFENWQRAIWDPRTGLKYASAYKGQPVFVLTDGRGNVKQRYTLKGAFPQSVEHGELSYTNSEAKVLTVTYAYDYAELDIMDDKPVPDPDPPPDQQAP